MRVLNLYAGIGGNRKLWDNCDVTAVEHNPEIAEVYAGYYPDDTVVIGDAHQFLLDYVNEYDFIWSSPPCQTHSDIRRCGAISGRCDFKYPDMSLYQEIIFLQGFCKCKWVVENVVPYYTPLIPPTKHMQRHLFWSNFNIYDMDYLQDNRGKKHNDIIGSSTIYGIKLPQQTKNKRQLLRNMVNPEIGLHIYNMAIGNNIKSQQLNLF